MKLLYVIIAAANLTMSVRLPAKHQVDILKAVDSAGEGACIPASCASFGVCTLVSHIRFWVVVNGKGANCISPIVLLWWLRILVRKYTFLQRLLPSNSGADLS